MFIKIQIWFPFNIQVYINGRKLLERVFDVNVITYECYDNSFTNISDVANAQELDVVYGPVRVHDQHYV